MEPFQFQHRTNYFFCAFRECARIWSLFPLLLNWFHAVCVCVRVFFSRVLWFWDWLRDYHSWATRHLYNSHWKWNRLAEIHNRSEVKCFMNLIWWSCCNSVEEGMLFWSNSFDGGFFGYHCVLMCLRLKNWTWIYFSTIRDSSVYLSVYYMVMAMDSDFNYPLNLFLNLIFWWEVILTFHCLWLLWWTCSISLV